MEEWLIHIVEFVGLESSVVVLVSHRCISLYSFKLICIFFTNCYSSAFNAFLFGSTWLVMLEKDWGNAVSAVWFCRDIGMLNTLLRQDRGFHCFPDLWNKADNDVLIEWNAPGFPHVFFVHKISLSVHLFVFNRSWNIEYCMEGCAILLRSWFVPHGLFS